MRVPRSKLSPLRGLIVNVWVVVCVGAVASCAALVAQLLRSTGLVELGDVRTRIALSSAAVFGALAGLYGIVAAIMLAVRGSRLRRSREEANILRERNRSLEARHAQQTARLDELVTLREMATIVNQESDFAIIAEKALELVYGLLEPLEATIFLKDAAQGKMRPYAQYADGKVLNGRKIPRQTIADFRLSAFESHSIICRFQDGKLNAIVPLKVQDSVIGVLFLVFRADARPGDMQIVEFNRTRHSILLEIAHHISLALKTKYLHTRAVVDGLTGLYSKSHFQNQLGGAIERAQRTQEAFCLLLADIDHFKRVNDKYGHSTGDVVLRRIGECVRRSLRRYDTAYRCGGEELAIILPATRIREATGIAERLRKLIEGQKFKGANGESVAATVSLGVAQYQPDDDTEAIFERTDRRLYAAKRGGRNRVVPAAA